MGPCDRLFALFGEAAQRLGSGQVEWHGEHVMYDETVEFVEKWDRAVFASSPEDESRLGRDGRCRPLPEPFGPRAPVN